MKTKARLIFITNVGSTTSINGSNPTLEYACIKRKILFAKISNIITARKHSQTKSVCHSVGGSRGVMIVLFGIGGYGFGTMIHMLKTSFHIMKKPIHEKAVSWRRLLLRLKRSRKEKNKKDEK